MEIGMPPEIRIIEHFGTVMFTIRGLRATAELTSIESLGDSRLECVLPDGYKWLWFNRLINQSGQRGIGGVLLDAVLEYARKENLGILNQVNAYGDIKQSDLEVWYIKKGFQTTGVENLLIWLPNTAKKS